jgi:hypothetical protein
MTTRLYLTDDAAAIAGYRRAKLERRSDNAALVRAVTATVAGPSGGIPLTRIAGGAALAWITDPLSTDDLTAAPWELHAWVQESDVLANASLRLQVFPFTNVEGPTALLDSNPGDELPTTMGDVQRTTGNATITALAPGDRLVIRLLLDDATAGSLAAGWTATLAYNGAEPRAEGDTWLECPNTLTVFGSAVPDATRDRLRRNLKDRGADDLGSDETDAQLKDDELDDAISEAVRTYSRLRPRLLGAAASGDDAMFEFALPARWVPGFSTIREVEYPAGGNPRTVLELGDWEAAESLVGGQLLRFLNMVPAVGVDNILVRYTVPHVHTTEADSIPREDFDAFCWLASSYAALKMAARAAGSSDSTIAADSVQHRDAEQRWRSVSTALRKLFDDHLGLSAGANGQPQLGPAMGFAEWDVVRQQMYHDSRGR